MTHALQAEDIAARIETLVATEVCCLARREMPASAFIYRINMTPAHDITESRGVGTRGGAGGDTDAEQRQRVPARTQQAPPARPQPPSKACQICLQVSRCNG